MFDVLPAPGGEAMSGIVVEPVHIVYDHAPSPGPQHWDWRCLRCSEPVNDHAGPLARWRWRRAQR